jgi:hypothetical protein
MLSEFLTFYTGAEYTKFDYIRIYENVQIKTSYVALNFLCIYLILIWTFSYDVNAIYIADQYLTRCN